MRAPRISPLGNDRVSGAVGRFILFTTVGLALIFVLAILVVAGTSGAVAGAPEAIASDPGQGSVTFDDQTVPDETVWVTVTDDVEEGDVLAVWDDADNTLVGTATVESDGGGTVFVQLDEPIASDHSTLAATVHDDDPDPNDPSASKYEGAIDTASVSVATDHESVASGPISYATTSEGGDKFVEITFGEGNYQYLSSDQVTVYDRNGETDLATSEPTISGSEDNTVRVELDTNESLSPGASMKIFETEYDIKTTAGTIDEDGSDEPIAGETVAIVGNENEAVTIETPDRTIERTLGQDSEVRAFETADYSPGDSITVTFESSGQTSILDLADLGLTTETDTIAYWNDDTVLTSTTADRNDREIEFKLQDNTGEPVDSQYRYFDRLNTDGEATTPIDLDTYSLEPGIYRIVAKDIVSATSNKSNPIIVSESTTASPSFDRSDYTQFAGDIVEFTVDTQGQYFTQVNLTDTETEWRLSFMIEDPVKDEVDIEFNTYNIGGHAAQTVRSDDARITEFGHSSMQYTDLALSDSAVELEVRFPPAESGDEAIIDLEPPTADGITTHVAPAGQVDSVDSPQEILNMSTERSTLTEGDLLVIDLEATGVFGSMVDGNEIVRSADPTLSITRTDDGGGEGQSYTIGGSNVPATAIPDPSNGRLLVVIDESAVETIGADDSWDVSFERGSDGSFTTQRESTTFDVIERSIELTTDREDGRLAVPNAESAPITVDTNVAPGTEIGFSLRMAHELQHTTATVDEDGIATANFDLSGYDEGGDIISIDVVDSDSSIIASEPGVVVASEEGMQSTVEVTAPESVAIGDDAVIEVTVTNDGLSAGSTEFVMEIDGEEVQSELMVLEPGQSETFEFNVDTNSSGNVEWTAETDREKAEGVISIAGGDGIPSFGLIAALVAIFGVALAAHRLRG